MRHRDTQHMTMWANGRKTSISLEPAYVGHIRRLAKRDGLTLNELASKIERQARGRGSNLTLSAEFRLYVLFALETEVDQLKENFAHG